MNRLRTVKFRPRPQEIQPPISISVMGLSYGSHNSDTPGGKVPTYTQLFRGDSRLPEALGHAYARHKKGSELSVVSAGCSIGAEVDSLAALHRSSNFGGRLAIAGFDISQEAITRARSGVYLLPNFLYDDDNLRQTRATLRAHGFSGKFDRNNPDVPSVFARDPGHIVNAARVRQGHDVKFEVRDLAAGSPEQDADLILANHMLYHLIPSEATRVLGNLAGMMTEKTVLSIGTWYDDSKNMADGETIYDEWLEDTTGLFGLSSVDPSEDKQIFVRA